MNRLKQVLAANARMKNEMQEACTTTDNENGYNIILKLVDIELKQELNISLAIIADCMLEDRQGSGTQEEINEKAIKIINRLCDQIEGCENCFYCKDNAQCEPMAFIKKLEQGKEKNKK
jgi:hypothetical protein